VVDAHGAAEQRLGERDAGGEGQREEHESRRDDAEEKLLERKQRRQVSGHAARLVVQATLEHCHERGVQRRNHEQAVGDHAEREMQLEGGGIGMCAARGEAGKERGQRDGEGGEGQHERLHSL
jgi:hypothetical protein